MRLLTACVLLLFAPTALAAAWFPAGKPGADTNYWEKQGCEEAEGVECLDTQTCPLDECDVKIVDGKRQLVQSPQKMAEKQAQQRDRVKKVKDREDLRNRIEVECASAQGLLKNLCEYALGE